MWHLRSAALSEGLGFDSRGFLTVIGFEVPAFAVNEFPGQIAPIGVFIFEQALGEEPLPAGAVLTSRAEVHAPDGTIVFLDENRQTVLTRGMNPNLPNRLQHFAQMAFVAQKPGQYRADLALLIDNEPVPELTASRTFMVLDADTLRATTIPE